jgi:pimeloyl-ACP methyl ester carboxylesterase
MNPATSTPDTIVLVHGFWVTPRSWEHWIERYEGKGLRVVAPAYPGFEVEVEALNADPTPIERVTVQAIIERFEAIVGELASPPIIIGHSAGGVFTQILLDHGFGAAGVAINSAPTEGVKRVPLSQVRASFPVLKNPANRQRPSASPSSSGTTRSPTAFSRTRRGGCTSATTSPRPEIFWGSALANIHPGRDETWVNYDNEGRAPLLFISGSVDHLMPPSIHRSNAKHWNDNVITEVKEFEGPHLLPAWPGWEQVADYALDWALEHTARPSTR